MTVVAGDPFFTRAYSASSAAHLDSGRKGRHRKNAPRAVDLSCHLDLSNRVPTGLVSVSSRLIDTLKRALAKHYRGGEDPRTIWIAFVKVPAGTSAAPRPASELAQHLLKYTDEEARMLKYEYLFDWEIPASYVVHRVCVADLIARAGLGPNSKAIRTLIQAPWSFHDAMARIMIDYVLDDARDAGTWLGIMVRAFGHGAPAVIPWVTARLRDELLGLYLNNTSEELFESQIFAITWPRNPATLRRHVEFSELCELDESFDRTMAAALEVRGNVAVGGYNRFLDWYRRVIGACDHYGGDEERCWCVNEIEHELDMADFGFWISF